MAEIKSFSGDYSLAGAGIVVDEKQGEVVYFIGKVRSYRDAYVNRLPIVWFSGDDEGNGRQCVQMTTRVPGRYDWDYVELKGRPFKKIGYGEWVMRKISMPSFGAILYHILPLATAQEGGLHETRTARRRTRKASQPLRQASIQERRRTKGRRQSSQGRNKKKPHKMGRDRDRDQGRNQDRVVHPDDVYEDDMESYELAMKEDIMKYHNFYDMLDYDSRTSSSTDLFDRYFDPEWY